jgi:two-component system chemotaxis response regulator CheY
MSSCLLVDDSATVRKVLGNIVKNAGLVPLEVANGKEALQHCSERMPSVIILDWNMPVMNGITFLRELRKMKGGLEPKVIFCTSVNELPQIEEALDAGADEYIMKPFDEELIRIKLIQTGCI